MLHTGGRHTLSRQRHEDERMTSTSWRLTFISCPFLSTPWWTLEKKEGPWMLIEQQKKLQWTLPRGATEAIASSKITTLGMGHCPTGNKLSRWWLGLCRLRDGPGDRYGSRFGLVGDGKSRWDTQNSMYVCVCVCVRACVRACVRVCVCS